MLQLHLFSKQSNIEQASDVMLTFPRPYATSVPRPSTVHVYTACNSNNICMYCINVTQAIQHLICSNMDIVRAYMMCLSMQLQMLDMMRCHRSAIQNQGVLLAGSVAQACQIRRRHIHQRQMAGIH